MKPFILQPYQSLYVAARSAEGILLPVIPRDPGLNENVFYRRHSSRYANNINAL